MNATTRRNATGQTSAPAVVLVILATVDLVAVVAALKALAGVLS